MYWIYLVLFILAVLIPDIIPGGYKILSIPDEKIEEVLIFSLGILGFLIFRFKERQSNKNLMEKIKFQKEAHQISKSLTDTYSYIGETNRKLDIMKNISMNLLDVAGDIKKEKRFLNAVMEAIYILGKSRKFIIRFINVKTGETEREIKSGKKVFLRADNNSVLKSLNQENKSFIETGYHFIIVSPKKINDAVAAIIISKNNQQQKLDDPEILKALASQILFIHHCSREKLGK